MLRLIAFAFFTTTSLTSSLAANLDFTSRIDRVTVYPQGASVTRIAEGQIPAGDHVIILKDLPGTIQAESVRVKGAGDQALTQNSVDVRQVAVNESSQPEERIRLERQIEDLQDEYERINRTFSDNQLQRDLLQAIASKVLVAEGTTLAVTGEGMTDLLQSAAVKLNALGDEEREMRGRQRAINREINDLQNRINDLASRNTYQTVVMINVSAQSAVNSAFSIEYKIEEAGWRPVYDASLNLGKNAGDAGLDLERRALVTQHSAESWDGVMIALSTARPSSATAATMLDPFIVDELQIVEDKVRMAPSSAGQLMMKRDNVQNFSLEAEEAVPAAAPEVTVELAGFQAVFQIPGRASIANTGESKTLTIDRFELPVDLHVLSVPRQDSSAYLVAGFTFDGKTPLLPGQVMLNRDGAFIGRGQIAIDQCR